MEQALFDLGYQSFICSTAESAAHEARYVAMFLSRRVGGVIAASAEAGAAHFAQLRARGIPIVAIDRDLHGYASDAIVIDHDLGGRMMAQHLIDLGHRTIAVIGAPLHSQSIQRRLAGVRAALRPRWRIGCAMVVSRGKTKAAEGISSNPMIDRSCGMRRP